jgi:hypothetical protein
MKKLSLAVAISLGLWAALGGPSPARADPATIDNFSATQGPLVISPAMPTSPVFSGLTPAPGAIGDARGITLTRTSGGGIVQADVNLSLPATFSLFSSPATQASALLKYDASAAMALNPTGLGGKNLTGTVTGHVASDLGGSLVFTFFTDATHFSQVTLPVGAGSAFDISVPTSGIGAGPGAAGPADFTNIGAVTVQVDSTSGAGNFFLTNLGITGAVVPEPGTLAVFSLCLAGVTGVGLYRRRKILRLAPRGDSGAG